jgi:hypothetical protein
VKSVPSWWTEVGARSSISEQEKKKPASSSCQLIQCTKTSLPLTYYALPFVLLHNENIIVIVVGFPGYGHIDI